MALFTIKNLTFSYPDESPCLKNINCTVEEGELLLLLGDSGSGKTTLLKHLKPQLTPYGQRTGSVFFDGRPLMTGKTEREAFEIGYVFQNPSDQIVTDKVWHELAFGLENLGLSQKEMERRICEVVSYFGMEEWLYEDTWSLSGGQMQQLNLAAVLAMQPRAILLDEPTSQLDPVAAKQFLFLVKQLKEELGVTIIMSEHHNDIVYPMADRIAYLKQGELVFCGDCKEAVDALFANSPAALPTVTRIYAGIEKPPYKGIPFDLARGRGWLKGRMDGVVIPEEGPAMWTGNGKEGSQGTNKKNKNTIISARELYFRYEKHGRDIIRQLSINIERGQCFGIMGGNGSGKSTLLKVLAGIAHPYAGKLKVSGEVAYLSQNPQNHFTSDFVSEELSGVEEERIREFGLDVLEKQHPYDLSGGEQQRLALLKVLQRGAEILLLDEPVKGLDEANRQILGRLIVDYCYSGKTVVLVTHDVEFAARYCDHIGMLFDGRVTGVSDTRSFLLQNQFYTTIARRLTKDILPDVLLEEEVRLVE